MSENEPAKIGRPSKYEPEYCGILIEAAREGLSLTAFAGMVEVARSTINEWMAAYPEFSEAVKRHASIRTLTLERGLLASDMGPRVTARIFALKNAAPDEWRDKQETALTGPNGGPIQVEEISDEQRAKALANFIARTKAQGDGK